MSVKLSKPPGIRNLYRPSEEEQDVLTHVYERYRAMKESPERLAMEKEATMGEKAWDAFRSEKENDDWQSNYYIPLTTSVIESILAEFIDQRLRPLILPRGTEDEPRAQIMKYLFDYTWDVADGDFELFNIFKSALIRGTGFGQEYYLRDRRIVKDIVKLKNKNGKVTFDTKEREVFEYDDEMMEEVSFWDMFVDEQARDFNRGPFKARDCIRRYIMDIEVFKQFFAGPMWNPMDNVKYVQPGGNTEYYQFYKPPQGLDHSKQVEVLWYWSRKPDDACYIVANDVVIKMGPNFFKHKQLPFAKCVDVTRLDGFYGKGEPKLLESIQEELNTLRRMMIDRHHLDLDKSFLVSQTTQLDDTDLIARPHALIPVDDPNSVKALEYGDTPMSVQLTQKAIGEDSIRVTGIDDRAQSLQRAPATATEAAILKEATLKRINMKLVLLSRGFMTDISRQRVANLMQFYSQPQMEKIVGDAATKEYQDAVQQAIQNGTLVVKNDVPYKQSYRQIPVEGKNFGYDERGNLTHQDSNGYGFFEARPEYFMPVARGGYAIKFEAGSTLQISKPLMQSKANELFDRLISLTQATTYDAEKLGDMIVRVNDYDPSELKKSNPGNPSDPNAQGNPQQVSDNRLQLAAGLATQENQAVANGQPIPPNGTPFVPPAHTEIHIAFLKSPAGKKLPLERYKMLAQHVMGEILAQEARRGGTAASGPQDQAGQAAPGLPSGGSPQLQPPPPPGSTPNNMMGNMMPSKVQGGNQTQTGMPFGPSR